MMQLQSSVVKLLDDKIRATCLVEVEPPSAAVHRGGSRYRELSPSYRLYKKTKSVY